MVIDLVLPLAKILKNRALESKERSNMDQRRAVVKTVAYTWQSLSAEFIGQLQAVYISQITTVTYLLTYSMEQSPS
jgi:hypothetical protein